MLAKATKIIPVMLMGKLVSNKKYERYEYLVAILISLGMMAFLFGKVTKLLALFFYALLVFFRFF